MKIGEWIVILLGAAVLAVIIFVRAGQLSGESGGNQASSIIKSTASGVGTVLNGAEGMQISS